MGGRLFLFISHGMGALCAAANGTNQEAFSDVSDEMGNKSSSLQEKTLSTYGRNAPSSAQKSAYESNVIASEAAGICGEVLDANTTRLKSVHVGAINSIISTPLGCSYLLTCSDDKTMALQPLENDGDQSGGANEHTTQLWKGHSREVNRIVCNEHDIFSCSRDLTIKRWSWQHDKPVATYEGHTLTVSALSIKPDGKKLASGARDNSVRIWDIPTGKECARKTTPRNLVTCLKWFQGDCNLLAQGSEDLKLRVWDLRTSILKSVETYSGYVYFPLCLDVSADGNEILTGSKGFNGVGCEIRLWDRRAGKTRLEAKGHEQDVKFCAFLKEHPRLAVSGSKDKSIRLWDLENTTGRSCVADVPMHGDGSFSAMCLAGEQANDKLTMVYSVSPDGMEDIPELFKAKLDLANLTLSSP